MRPVVSYSNRVILRIRDYHSHCRRSAAQVGLLIRNVDHRRPQDLRDGLRTLQRHAFLAAVCKAIAQAMPCKVLDSYRFRKCEILLPRGFTIADGDASCYPCQHTVFRVKGFDCELARARVRRLVGNSGAQYAERVGGDDRISGWRLRCLEEFY
jgi:hypothetical protein